MKTKVTNNKSTNVSKNTLVQNGMTFIKQGNYLIFTGRINPVNSFHSYLTKQTI